MIGIFLIPVAQVLYEIKYVIEAMNAFDKHSKNFTAWCENCDEVFDRLSAGQILMRMRHITIYELLNFGLRIDDNPNLSEFSSHTIAF